jgi:hypothetical protein
MSNIGAGKAVICETRSNIHLGEPPVYNFFGVQISLQCHLQN